ncbi:MAG: hypothetical protein QM278_04525 [Pseudomonadota bacterium]|nr:hypothetical protein [Pseudomonadota bacterium]
MSEMLKIVTEAKAIQRCRRQMARRIRMAATERIPVVLGHQGASIRARVWWSEELGFWFHPGRGERRYWNAFGLDRPRPGASLPITCEINFTTEGIDRRIGGAFAKDSRGRVFVVHRGVLGGGRKGIGKVLFEKWYRGVWMEMDDGGEAIYVAVVGVLQSPRFVRQVAQFISKIEKIKDMAAPSVQTEIDFEDLRLREELLGTRRCELNRDLAGRCDHGLVVKDLAAALRQQGCQFGNDGLRDLLALDPRGETTIFEIETDTLFGSIQEGATRLLVNSLLATRPPRLVLVLPAAPDAVTARKLQRLNIDVLIYRWDENHAVFPGLETSPRRDL